MFITGMLMVCIKKAIVRNQPQQIAPAYNNRSKNETIVTFAGLVVIGMLLAATIIHLILMTTGVVKYKKGTIHVNSYFSVFYLPSIIMPILYMTFKPKILIKCYEALT